ncbi:MAG: phosphohydrolase, partial [Desulfuromonadaceae bacterium]
APLRDLFNRALASLGEEELRPLRAKWFGPAAATALPTADSGSADSMVEEAFLQAVSDRPDQVVSYRSQGREYLAFSTPVFGDGEYLGMILPADVILKPYMKTVAISLGAALIALLFSLPLILYSTSLIVKPIKALMVENEKVKKREFERVTTVKSNICELLELSDSLVAMAGSIQAYQKAQEELMDSFLRLISESIDAKSTYTSGHCNRVPELATRLARAASASELPCFTGFRMSGVDQWREFRLAAWLHDCGKLVTPIHVVDKATKLETIYNRIHEVRTRFEVLWRDARIDALEKRLAGGEPGTIETDLQRHLQQLVEDFGFVADCNVGAVSMDPANRQRLQGIAARTWVRHFDNRIGLSKEEEQRWPEGAIAPPPATERLLADKPEHLMAHDDAKLRKYAATRFNLPLPEVQYNFGEVYN